MPNVLQKCDIVLYADDTLIFNLSKTGEECQIKLNYEISKLNKWLKINKLKLNEYKTKIMEINMNNNSGIKVNNKTIKLYMKDMNFKDHIGYICKKNC